jgi:hypothetical protein
MNENHPPEFPAVELGMPRSATADISKYVLSIDDAIARYEDAGIPRIRRTVQRYCANKTLDAYKVAVPYGEKYLITPESLARHIAYILEARSAMADRGAPRPNTGGIKRQDSEFFEREVDAERHPAAVEHGSPRSAAVSPHPENLITAEPEVLNILRTENQFLKDQITVKDAQLSVKDQQIADQSERVRETNLLVASLHKLITPLLGGRSHIRNFDPASHEDIPSPPP